MSVWLSKRTLLLSLVVLLTATGTALAAWAISGSGNGYSHALSMPTGATPTVAISGYPTIAVSWSAVTVGGVAVDSYAVRRYTDTGTLQTIGSACSGAIAALTCNEASVPVGRWQYTVAATKASWNGAEGTKSRVIEIAAPPSSVSCSNCHSYGGNSYINAAGAASVSIQVVLPASSLATDTVNLSLTDGTHTVSASQAATAGAGTVTFTGLNATTLTDGSVTASAYITANTSDISSTTSATLIKDVVAPSGSDIHGTNGGVLKQIDGGDTVIYTFSEAMDPGSILGSWNGSSTAVTIALTNSGSNDSVSITGANLGVVSTHKNYAGAAITCPGTMVMSGSTVTVTFPAAASCTPSNKFNANQAASQFTWVPVAAATDHAGNPDGTATVSESGGSQANF